MRQPMKASLAAVLSFVLLGAGQLTAQGDLDAMVATLKEKRDDVDPALIEKIANVRSRAAMQALVDAYGKMRSIYMRREIVRALSAFAGVTDAQEPALEHVTNVATNSEDPELRQAAVETLEKCKSLGKHFLATIVESDAYDDVREMAMKAHVAQADESDLAWYRKIWKPSEDEKARKKKRRKKNKGEEPPPRRELDTIREAAFGGLAKHLEEKELAEVLTTEGNPRIRRAALLELHRRGSAKTRELAEKLFGRVDVPGSDRAQAAEILAALDGKKMAKAFIDLAKKKAVTPEDMRRTMAALIRDMNDKAVNKKMVSMLGRGKPHEKIFALLATAHLDDEKILKRVRKGLRDKDFGVRRVTCELIAQRQDKGAIKDLMKMLEKPRVPDDARIAIDALGVLRKGDPDWVQQLVTFAKGDNRDVRNAALEQLAKDGDPAHVPLLIAALGHDDWSTRLTAVKALVTARDKRAIEPLIDRLPQEDGRLADAVADALWSLTGQPWERDVRQWKRWWSEEGAGFSVISEAELAKAAEKRELRRLKARTSAAQFFGIRIVSHRVIFVIDISGSMTAPVQGHLAGKRNATRIEIAKQELAKSIDALDPEALFNVIAFSSGVSAWLEDGLGGLSGHTREEAVEWVQRLGASGATNLYDALKLAFADPDADTIIVLSDGEPTAGGEIDPDRIRQDVKFWNEHRGLVINTIAIGGSLQVLEWLAADSGGEYVRFR